MRKQYYFIVFIFFSLTSSAQTIINAERFIEKDSTIYSLGAAYNGTRGNSTIDKIDINPVIIFVKKKNEFRIFGGYSLLADSGNGILNSGFIHFRHNFKISNKFKTFEFYQQQFNDVLLLNQREVFGGGLRYSLIKRDSFNLDFEAGIMKEKEVLNKSSLLINEEFITNCYRVTVLNSIKWKINKTIQLYNILYYQPKIGDFSDFRILNDFSLNISISKHLQLVNLLTIRYDNQPPGILKNYDTALSLGLNINF